MSENYAKTTRSMAARPYGGVLFFRGNKWSADIDQSLRLRTLQHIAALDVRVHFVFLHRNNIPVDFRVKAKIESGVLYTHVIGELLDLYLPTPDKDFRVYCDRRHLKKVTRKKFMPANWRDKARGSNTPMSTAVGCGKQ